MAENHVEAMTMPEVMKAVLMKDKYFLLDMVLGEEKAILLKYHGCGAWNGNSVGNVSILIESGSINDITWRTPTFELSINCLNNIENSDVSTSTSRIASFLGSTGYIVKVSFPDSDA